MENFDADIIIIGAGASAVSAAWPLVKAGKNVLMLAPHSAPLPTVSEMRPFYERRVNDTDQWETYLGKDFVGVGNNASETPKMKVPTLRFVQKGFDETYRIKTDGISATGSLVAGGLTQMWGAGAFCYNEADIVDIPVNAADMKKSYQKIASRIGISGVADDDISPILGTDINLQSPIELHPTMSRLIGKYTKIKNKPKHFTLGRTRNAVLTTDLNGRQACNLSNNCLWGCSRQSIYSAAQELPNLQKYENFRLDSDCFVEAILPTSSTNNTSAYRVFGKSLTNSKRRTQYQANKIILAAGTLGTTNLAIKHLGAYDMDHPICTHPAYATAGLYWRRAGTQSAKKAFALGHLAYQIKPTEDLNDAAFGVIFPAEGLLMSDLSSNMPLTTPSSIALTRAIAPALVVANGYLTSDHARSTLSVDREGNTTLSGQYEPSFDPTFKAVTTHLRKAFLNLGILPLPGATRRANLGSDGHFAGGVPMRAEAPQSGISTNPDGELRGAPGIYVVDGASWPRLSLKHPTFTFMANADRISSILSARIN